MAYRLYAIAAAGFDWRRTGRLIGTFARLEQARLALNGDVLNQLRDRGGWRLRISHAIVGPDSDSEVELSVVTLGVSPDRRRAPDGDDMAERVAWLAALRRFER
jgi:hypothetical protein